MKKDGFSEWVFKYRYALCFVAIGIVYFFNMFIDVMEIDAAQYAAMSREMMETGNYLQVHDRGGDYLDKPPLLFWLASLSMKLFGISNFAFKLPAILFLIMGIYATYRFTLDWYDKQRAMVAALILCSTQGFFLMSNDVRTDGILTGLLIYAIWQTSCFIKRGKLLNLILGAIALSGALMTKGPIALIILAFAIGGDLLLKRKWKTIFKPEWLLFLLIAAILLIPMCYGLYMQYDLHPEKEVYQLKGPSGLRFFFWTQSFGRITGEIYWNNNPGYFFFYHSILWDFQPWILFFIPALIILIIKLIRTRLRVSDNDEYISFFGFLLSFLALSQSSYKLPHYIFPLFPFAATITANFIVWLAENKTNIFKRMGNIQFGILHLFFIGPLIYFIFFFPPSSPVLPIVIGLLFILYWYMFKNTENKIDKLVLTTITACFAFGLVMGASFYPNVLNYQGGSVAGKEITKLKVPKDMFYSYNTLSQSLEVYAQRTVPWAKADSMTLYKKGTILFVDQKNWEIIKQNPLWNYKIIRVYDNFYVTALSIPFLLKSQRQSTLDKRYLLEKY